MQIQNPQIRLYVQTNFKSTLFIKNETYSNLDSLPSMRQVKQSSHDHDCMFCSFVILLRKEDRDKSNVHFVIYYSEQ